jgi:protein-S-isoprenylcysteine O-methyltransferase Ste14
MNFLEHRVPPPLAGLLCAGAMWYLATLVPAIALPQSVRLIATAALGAAGLLVMLAGVVSFHLARTTVNPLKPEAATALVTSGVYRYTRNPMYLGMLLLLVAWAAYLASPPALAGAVAFWLYIGRFQIRPEERALAALFGTAFSDYASRVRRWL